MMQKIRVAHFIRKYLQACEPFIGYQVIGIESCESHVFAKIHIPNELYDVSHFHGLETRLAPFQKQLAVCSYHFFKRMTRPEINYVLETIKHEKIKLLHFHYGVDARYFLPILKAVKLPKIVSFYGYDASSFPKIAGGLGKIYMKPIFNHITLALAMSEDMKQDLIAIGCPSEKVRVHYYGIELDKFMHMDRKYEDAEELTILLTGSFEERKGHRQLLEAVARIKPLLNGQKLRINFVGNGPLERDVLEKARKLNLEAQVYFSGFLSRKNGELIKAYQNADIFTLPCVTEKDGTKEGIPGTLVEAMAAGLPVISTYHAGVPSVVKHNENGFLCQENNVDQLAQILLKLIKDRKLRKKIGKAAAQDAKEKLDCSRRIQDLEKIYSDLIECETKCVA